MRRTLRAIFLPLIGCAAGNAQSAPPPFGEVLTLSVTSCQSVTFESPRGTSSQPANETLRATLVLGTVIDASNFTESGGWPYSFEPPASKLVGQSYTGFVLEARAESCPSSVPSAVQYVRVWGCDVGIRSGDCLPPSPQLRLRSPGEVFNTAKPGLRG
jgi:hypothetical protein